MGGKLSSEARRITAGDWATQLNGGTMELYEGGTGGDRIARFTSLIVADDNAGKVIISDGGTVTERATATPNGIDAFVLKTSGGSVWMSGSNDTITVGASGQGAPDAQTFQLNGHGMVNNQVVVGSGSLPGAVGTVNWNLLFVKFVDVNHFQLLSGPKKSPIQIASASGGLVLMPIPPAVGNETSEALVKLLNLTTTYGQGEPLSFSGFTISMPEAIF